MDGVNKKVSLSEGDVGEADRGRKRRKSLLASSL
jgi:hypothetical protein